MDKIEMCMWCGEVAVLDSKEEDDDDGNIYFIHCRHCHARGPKVSLMVEAIQGWNRYIIQRIDSCNHSDNTGLLDKIKELEENFQAKCDNEEMYLEDLSKHQSKISNLEYKLTEKDKEIKGLNDVIRKGFEYILKEKYSE